MLGFFSLLSIAAYVNGLTIPQLENQLEARSGPAPLALDFTVSKTIGNQTVKEFWASARKVGISRRGSYPEIITDISDVSYNINIYLGDNRQLSTVALDTGSSDLWVTSSTYTPGDSAQNTWNPFDIGYADGSTAQGYYYLDDLAFSTLGNPTVLNFQFALVDSDLGGGILGIADKNQEASIQTGSGTYNNLPWALQLEGFTPKASYSLYLGPDRGSGTVIFGGIDTDKYTGTLTKYSTTGGGQGVNVASINVNGDSITANEPYILDSGTSLGFTSAAVQSQLDSLFNPTIVPQGDINYRQVSCNQPTDKYVTFNFGQNLIKFSFAELINHEDDGTCFLGFTTYQDYRILGDVFLRKAYVYYDLTDKTISLAEALYSSSSNIISA